MAEVIKKSRSQKKGSKSRGSKKKSTKKTASRPTRKPASTTRSSALSIGRVRDSSKVEFAGTGPRGSMYDAVVEQANELEPGQSFPVAPPEGVSLAQLQNRLGAAFRRARDLGQIKPRKGSKIVRRTNTEGAIEICCVETR